MDPLPMDGGWHMALVLCIGALAVWAMASAWPAMWSARTCREGARPTPPDDHEDPDEAPARPRATWRRPERPARTLPPLRFQHARRHGLPTPGRAARGGSSMTIPLRHRAQR